MKRQCYSLLASSLIHALLFGGIYATGCSRPREAEPVLIDFSLLGGAGGSSRRDPAAEGRRAAGQGDRRRSLVVPGDRATVHSSRRTVARSVVAEPKPAADERESASVPLQAQAASSASRDAGSDMGAQGGSGQLPTVSGSAGVEGGSAAAKGAALPSGGNGGSAEQLRTRYIREQFLYIRNLIRRNIRYPVRARRLGWSGTVLVSFVIHEDGRVSSERVVSSSGHDLLDSNVVSTIREVAPFPRPPVKAELRIPVTYALE